jgi:hypothetical protein
MTTTAQDITVYEGEDKTILISVTDTSGGSAVNLTGATTTWVVTTGASSNTAIISKTSTDAEITYDNDAGTNDRINIALASADTQGQEGNVLYHECKVVDSGSDTHIVATGKFTVRHASTL